MIVSCFQIFKEKKKKWNDLLKMLPKKARKMFVWSLQRRWFSQSGLFQNFTPPKPKWILCFSVWRINLVSVEVQCWPLDIAKDLSTYPSLQSSKFMFWNLNEEMFFFFSVAVVRVAGALQKSTEVMKAMQSLVKIPEIQATMRDLSKEMMKVSSSIKLLQKLECHDLLWLSIIS